MTTSEALAATCTGRRARRFLTNCDELRMERSAEAGVGERFAARSEHAEAAGLRWQDRDVHTRLTNVRHPILVGA